MFVWARRGSQLCLLASLSWCALGATENGNLAFRGFGTLGISCFSQNDWDFIREERPDGPGRSRPCDPKLDSNFGLQLDASLSESLEMTLQATSYHRADDTFTPEITLANLRWMPSERVTLRAGRLQNLLFFVSEYRNVLYAQPWARPPVEVYNLANVYAIDGLAISGRFSPWDWDLNLDVALAKSHSQIPVPERRGDTDTADIGFVYVGALLERGPWTFKGTLLRGRATYRPPALDALGASLEEAGFPNLAEDLILENKTALLASFGAKYENDTWLVQAEYVYRFIDALNRNHQGAYLFVGRRFGAWMPYFILGGAWSGNRDILRHLDPDPAFRDLRASLEAAVANTIGDQFSLAGGVSYRLSDQVVLKFQMDYVRPRNRPSDTPGPGILTTLNLDFIF